MSALPQSEKPELHSKARSATYPNSTEKRLPVADEKVPWSVKWADYKPTVFDTLTPEKFSKVPKPPDAALADLDKAKYEFNSVHKQIDRTSHLGKYEVTDGVPRNPMGRTGLAGRGWLWRWGPNHAADPVVTRWARDDKGTVVKSDGKGVLEFVAIQRTDGGGWAIPGGMVEPGDTVSATLKKEFGEEALNTLEMGTEEEKSSTQKQIDDCFAKGTEIFKGYCDDPRNTDNSWMETVVYNFHDGDGTSVGKFKLHAGDDAAKVQWMRVDGKLKLYASHSAFLKRVAELRKAHW